MTICTRFGRFKKPTKSRVWLLYEQNRTHELIVYRFMLINKFMGMKTDPKLSVIDLCPSDTHCHIYLYVIVTLARTIC
jgi:hypothetical protein